MAFHNDAFQQGVSGGAQLGIQYHFQTPYYLGVVVSVMSNANKARLVELLENSIVPAGGIATDINQEFRAQSNLDIAALIGADITDHTHLYAKVGASCARFANHLFITQAAQAPFPIPSFQQIEKKNLWGWAVGLGLTRDLNKWMSMFLEYDHYDYGALNLRSLNNFTPLIPAAQTDRLTQNVVFTANAIRIGLNVKFEF